MCWCVFVQHMSVEHTLMHRSRLSQDWPESHASSRSPFGPSHCHALTPAPTILPQICPPPPPNHLPPWWCHELCGLCGCVSVRCSVTGVRACTSPGHGSTAHWWCRSEDGPPTSASLLVLTVCVFVFLWHRPWQHSALVVQVWGWTSHLCFTACADCVCVCVSLTQAMAAQRIGGAGLRMDLPPLLHCLCWLCVCLCFSDTGHGSTAHWWCRSEDGPPTSASLLVLTVCVFVFLWHRPWENSSSVAELMGLGSSSLLVVLCANSYPMRVCVLNAGSKRARVDCMDCALLQQLC